MIEKIRISLWDIFTFFMTGVFALIVTLSVLALTGRLPKHDVVIDFVIKLPTTYIIVVAPIVLTLLGLLIEPMANFFERYIGKHLYFWLKLNKAERYSDEVVMKDYIKNHCFGDLNNRIENPYHLCKDYVETKQLSTTFMVFLARYGFYRNCSFIVLVAGIFYFVDNLDGASFLLMLLSFLISALLTKRANEFYSYQGPAVYNAFLIDHLNWPAQQMAKVQKQTEKPTENQD
ncbi:MULTISPECIES: hypothetical protein [unclassified Arsukibacterium]|uniref:hypothetical protein n=1 Tax=unclassified Arsukibacterium TaxID=2635278 RepID=UPI000C423AEF|nr:MULTISPECIES: hypothetical protein [unclassified Arsukibacterium]MAA95380.1 hypothetical protein [Rheinheimera sp.]MBM35083.1 hypothetical protein [Rheinheimera sp.]HAW94497.1 hypothetical protein [Candidatus Azambacteria bacterium]|tara:strand:+ start:6107 stop:6802 length:696 start_codon:yes stop_codon:yes gene_type:complete